MGTEHFVYLSALNNLGLVYQDLKRYEEAERLHRQALAVLEKSGKRNAAFATTLNNLASVAMATGRYVGGRDVSCRRRSQLYEETAGKESVLYLTGLNNLAAVSFMAGDYGAGRAALSRRRWRSSRGSWGRTTRTGPGPSRNLARSQRRSCGRSREGRWR